MNNYIILANIFIFSSLTASQALRHPHRVSNKRSDVFSSAPQGANDVFLSPSEQNKEAWRYNSVFNSPSPTFSDSSLTPLISRHASNSKQNVPTPILNKRPDLHFPSSCPHTSYTSSYKKFLIKTLTTMGVEFLGDAIVGTFYTELFNN